MTPPESEDVTTPLADERAALKRERLQYTIEYAHEHSPFYRDLMDEAGVLPADIRTVDDLAKLPPVTGDDIRANQPPETETHRFRTHRGVLQRPFATSGSTGRPKMVYHSYDEIAAFEEMFHRIHQYWGIAPDNMFLNFFPCVGLNASGFLSEATYHEYGYATLPLLHTEMATEEECYFITTHETTALCGLPSQVHARTNRYIEAGYDPIDFGMDYIVLGGEPVGARRRAQLEDAWDAEVFALLGTTESMGHAAECRESRHLHVLDDRVHAEVLDEDGARVPKGERGHMTITNLLAPGEESSMPLIRYQPGDVTTALDESCSCAFSDFPLITQPQRAGWSFNFGGVVLDVLYFEDIIHDHPAIEDDVVDFQIYLDDQGEGGVDRAEVRIRTKRDRHAGTTARDVSAGETPTPAAAVGDSILRKRSTVQETVDIVDAAQIDVCFVDEIEHSKGKPDRLIDQREMA